MNIPIFSDSKILGVFAVKNGNAEWQKFFEIKNLEGVKNNPLFFGNKKNYSCNKANLIYEFN